MPVVDQEKPRAERGNEDEDAVSRAHRAFHDPHSLRRGGSAPTNVGERDHGQNAVMRRGPSGLVKNEKGQWVKPGKDTLAAAAAAADAASVAAGEPQRFIPERQCCPGYYSEVREVWLHVDIESLHQRGGRRDVSDRFGAGDDGAEKEARGRRRRGRQDRRDASPTTSTERQDRRRRRRRRRRQGPRHILGRSHADGATTV